MKKSTQLEKLLEKLDWRSVRRHYDRRILTHNELVTLLTKGSVVPFAELALGITDGNANYSADLHRLGPRIIGTNLKAEERVFALGNEFYALKDARNVPAIIERAKLSSLRIGVGSEISCMVNPHVCWVANVRTIWTHLVVKHNSLAKANEELALYRDHDAASEMYWPNWSAIHANVKADLVKVANFGAEQAKLAGIRCGDVVYLWADAIATHVYGMHHLSRATDAEG
ncbi:MAG: hypothetical protein ABSG56_32835 [Bryobacteraceae bacterium]|jgi:hypothetical protein